MDKKRKELLFLGAGLLVLLAALYFTLKPRTPAAQATAQPAVTASATAEQPGAPSAPAGPSAQIQPSSAPIPMSEGGTTAGRNPFTPVISTSVAVAPKGSPPPLMTAMRAPSLPPIEPMRLQLFQPGAGGAAPSVGGQTAGVIQPTAVKAPVDPPLRLTGVIYGNPSMAIIRKGDKRYFVRPGDPVGSRYVVQTISHRRVVLASSQGTLSLDLTGRL